MNGLLRYALVVLVSFSLSSIFAQDIEMTSKFFGSEYHQGEYQLSPKKVRWLMRKEKKSRKYWNIGESLNQVSDVVLVAGVVYFALKIPEGIVALRVKRNPNSAQFILTATAVGLSWLGLRLAANSSKIRAIDVYNTLNRKDKTHLHLGETKNGIGLVYSF